MEFKTLPGFRGTSVATVAKTAYVLRDDGVDAKGYDVGIDTLRRADLMSGSVFLLRPIAERLADQWHWWVYCVGVIIGSIISLLVIFQIAIVAMTIIRVLPAFLMMLVFFILLVISLILICTRSTSPKKKKE